MPHIWWQPTQSGSESSFSEKYFMGGTEQFLPESLVMQKVVFKIVVDNIR